MTLGESRTAVARVQDALQNAGIATTIVELSESTRTAAEAARAIDCELAQIAKSLVFRSASGSPILVIASGRNRVDESRLAAIVGEPIERAPPEFVRSVTGYAIGGVPPAGHETQLRLVLVDADLFEHDEIWAAAGTPHAIMRLTPDELLRLCGGRVTNVAMASP
jgi:prolyl-tRNA editing enzyme YbaK/EbsC (Cys-tRNA(Pro) deacylase)